MPDASRTAEERASPALVADYELALRIGEAVRAARGVAALSPGPGGEVATHGAGARVVGVRLYAGGGVPALRALRAEVRVVLDSLDLWPGVEAAREAALQAAAAAGQLLASVDIYVDDVLTEPPRR